MVKINWENIKRNKLGISRYKKKYGTQRAIYYTEGILGIKSGELLKYRPKIRRLIKNF